MNDGEPEENIDDEKPAPKFRKRRRSGEKGLKIVEDEESEEYDRIGQQEEVPDQNPGEAAKALIEDMGFIRLRLLAGALFCAVLLYINIAPKAGLYLPGMLSYVRNPHIYLFTGASLLIMIMLMCVKTVAAGLRDLIFLRPNMESGAFMLLSLIHTLSIMLMPTGKGIIRIVQSAGRLFCLRSIIGTNPNRPAFGHSRRFPLCPGRMSLHTKRPHILGRCRCEV